MNTPYANIFEEQPHYTEPKPTIDLANPVCPSSGKTSVPAANEGRYSSITLRADRPSVLELRLNDAERDRLGIALRAIEYCDAGSARYIAAVRRAAQMALPEIVLAVLAEQRTALQPRACLVLDNLPLDAHVHGSPCGAEAGLMHKSGHVSENLAVAIASLIGEPYSIAFEGRDIVNNLTPQPGHEREYTGLGSDVELDFHIENAALKFVKDLNVSPMGLVLTGVRDDPCRPKTRIACAHDALAYLDEVDLATDKL